MNKLYSENPASDRLKNKPKKTVLKVRGTDAIFLANRTDVAIPAIGSSSPTFPLLRHAYVRSDFLQETFPKSIPIRPKKTFTFSATGRIDFFNGTVRDYIPDGGVPNGSIISGLGGISGYRGAEGALVGLFLGKGNPAANPTPKTLNFTARGLGLSFPQLSPQLGQIFFIGNGRAGSNNVVQKFTAPEGATRLFVGLADGFGFDGPPGAYEDNNGFFRVAIRRLA